MLRELPIYLRFNLFVTNKMKRIKSFYNKHLMSIVLSYCTSPAVADWFDLAEVSDNVPLDFACDHGRSLQIGIGSL